MGRPTEYDPTICERIVEFFNRDPWTEHERTITRRDGSVVEETYRLPAELPTLANFACKIGVHRDTLNEWGRVHPEFSDAIKRAKAHQERILVSNGLCGLYEGPFGIFTAKNILGWRDKLDMEHSGDAEKPIRAVTEIINRIVDPRDSGAAGVQAPAGAGPVQGR